MSRTRRAVTASATAAALMLLPTAAAQADSAEVTRFPVTEPVYNNCTEDIVIVNATLVTSTKLTSKGDKMTYEQRTWYEDVSAQSNNGIAYKVTKGSIDSFRTTVRRGEEKIRSFQASQLRLKPEGVKGGELRVFTVNAWETDTSTGDTRVTADSYRAECK